MTPRIESDRTRGGRREVVATFAFTPYRTYRVELETWSEDGEPRSDCRIWRAGTRKSASLAMLQDCAFLEDGDGRTHNIEADHINEIAAWADKEGY